MSLMSGRGCCRCWRCRRCRRRCCLPVKLIDALALRCMSANSFPNRFSSASWTKTLRIRYWTYTQTGGTIKRIRNYCETQSYCSHLTRSQQSVKEWHYLQYWLVKNNYCEWQFIDWWLLGLSFVRFKPTNLGLSNRFSSPADHWPMWQISQC